MLCAKAKLSGPEGNKAHKMTNRAFGTKKPRMSLRSYNDPTQGRLGGTRRVYHNQYNCGMPDALFEDMKRYVGFDKPDFETLAGLKQLLGPAIPGIVELFYETLLRHPAAKAVLADDAHQIERLRQSLHRWLEELFSGCYGDEYFKRRCNIGRVHVQVNLPQHYMFTAMNIIRLALIEEINRLKLTDAPSKIAAVEKILDLELAIMNQTYREDLVARIRAFEQSRYEQKLSESEHLAAVGELAASLAHEIKNPLAGISGAIQIIGSSLDDNHPHKEIIGEALRQIDRLDAAVKDLLVYARPKPPVKAEVSLNDLLERVRMILREEPAFRSVRVRCDWSSEPIVVYVDETQFQQVLMNLMINAAHACHNNGEIVCSILPVESKIRIRIEDNGIGITPEVLGRIWEPFFTTKAKGTGLGLAICKRIVEAHEGTIDIQSRPGKGTCVTIDVPN